MHKWLTATSGIAVRVETLECVAIDTKLSPSVKGIFSDASVVELFTGTEEECHKFIIDFVEEQNKPVQVDDNLLETLDRLIERLDQMLEVMSGRRAGSVR
jgi:hypothetical protein